MQVAIVTDSTADLPMELAAEYAITIVPTILVIDGKSLEDGPDISRDSFYHQLPAMKIQPTTAAPSVGTFIETFEQLLVSGYEHIISIHLAQSLSGVFNAAVAGAQGFKGRVKVVDSEQISMGIGFQALAAAKAARLGVRVEGILTAIVETRLRTRVTAMLNTLEYIRRSGRISWAQANIGQILQIKPFLSYINGIILRHGSVRSRIKGVQRLHKILSDLGPLEHLAVLHTNPDIDAQAMAKKFARQTQHPPVIVQVTPVIGTHVGPNGLGFAAVVR